MKASTLIPPTLWMLVSKYAERNGIKPIQAWHIFLNKLVAQMEDGNYEFMGSDWKQLMLQMVGNDQMGSQGLPPIANPGKLHRSNRTGSGFVGVYTNGKGFRAMGRKPGVGAFELITIGTFPTAEQAAWARYLFYKKNKLPYGIVEEAIKEERERNPELWKNRSDQDVIDELNVTNPFMGKPIMTLDMGLEDDGKQPEDKPIEIAGGVDPSIFD